MTATLETLRRFIEHAPKEKPSAVAGWTVGEDQESLCGGCAGRVIDRGCQLPRPSDPVWAREPKASQCCICGKAF